MMKPIPSAARIPFPPLLPDLRRHGSFRWMRQLKRNRGAVIGSIFVAFFFLLGTLGPILLPRAMDLDPFQISRTRLSPPGTTHWFGTDSLGRDLFSQFIYGARTSMTVGIAAAGISTVIGVVIGGISGFFGGWVDDLLMRVTETLMVIPRFLLMMAIATIVGTKLIVVVLVIGGLGWPVGARIARAQFLTLRSREYVTAAIASGAGNFRLMRKSILPNALPPLIVEGTLQVGNAILLEAYLAFLGLSDASLFSWGQTLQNAQEYLDRAWWMAFFPGAGIFLSVLGLNLLGEGINEAQSPGSH